MLTYHCKLNFYSVFIQERHKILQKMGISVQDSGIAVEKGRYYLVNLNADPSLNEMLVYYLKVSIELSLKMFQGRRS